MPTKEQILNIANGLPVKNLINFIGQGIISIDDLERIRLSEDKLDSIKSTMIRQEEVVWTRACESGNITDFLKYLTVFPTGTFAEAARQALITGEEDFWQEVVANATPSLLQQYLDAYEMLGGMHVDECREMLNDPDWVQLKRNPTLAAMNQYEQLHPGQHAMEIAGMRDHLTDDIDWNNAVKAQSTSAYRTYIELHPQGAHADEAQRRIDASAGHDAFVEDMRTDFNAKQADEIQNAVDNGVITWNDVINIYGPARAQAIRGFNGMARLIDATGYTPTQLTGDSTEVYFWGTPSSGKTCALGSLLSGAQSYYSLEAQQCQGYNYMTRLSNVFQPNSLCSLPPSTSVDEIQEMIFTIYEEDKKSTHRMTFIDLAGEIFRAIYFDMNGMFLDDQHQTTLNHVKKFLADKRNPKIHFFVVEYGAENHNWEGLTMANYLSACSLFIKNNKILKNSSGVYILVTKCDKIGCPDDMVIDEAERYVKEHLTAFHDNLQRACEYAGISDFQVLPFSIGQVFAGKLCEYDDSYIDDVINVLLTKTKGTKKSKLNWLKS